MVSWAHRDTEAEPAVEVLVDRFEGRAPGDEEDVDHPPDDVEDRLEAARCRAVEASHRPPRCHAPHSSSTERWESRHGSPL